MFFLSDSKVVYPRIYFSFISLFFTFYSKIIWVRKWFKVKYARGQVSEGESMSEGCEAWMSEGKPQASEEEGKSWASENKKNR